VAKRVLLGFVAFCFVLAGFTDRKKFEQLIGKMGGLV